MRVLVACEYSGRVRDAFLALGHEALSCDLLPTDSPGPHYQGNVLDLLDTGWDLLIAHPPCTYLCNSGVRWLHEQQGRWSNMREGAQFFKRLLEAPIPRVAVENPVMHSYAAEIIGQRQTQIIQPYEFGHMERKATGLWLRGLPALRPTQNVYREMMRLPVKEREKVHYASPGPDRWKKRSTTYLGIAEAMAQQWSIE